MLAKTNNTTHVPAQFLKATDVKTVAAVRNVMLIERHNVSLLAEEKEALKRYIHASTPLCKAYLIEKENAFYVKLHTYLTVYCGFNLLKDENLFLQVQSVITQTGIAYPDFAIYEVFDAIDFCLARNPELCKSYDSKDGQSSFTAVWLCKIVNYYCTHATSARQIVGRLLAPIEKELSEIEAIRQSNLRKIRYYRDICMMIIQNVGEYLTFGRFKLAFTEMNYGEILYKNMQEVGFLKDSQEYRDIWAKWNPEKLTRYTNTMKFGFMKEVIVAEIEKYRAFDSSFYDTNVLYFIFANSEYVEAEIKGTDISVVKKSLKKQKRPTHAEIVICAREGQNSFSLPNPILGLAYQMGFLKDVKESDFDLSAEMSISDIIKKYGKEIISIYPLLHEEMIIRDFDPESHFSSSGQSIKDFKNKFKP